MDGNDLSSYNGDPLFEFDGTDAAQVVGIEQLRDLVQLLDQSEVSELEVKRAGGRTRLVLRKAKAPEGSVQQLAMPVPVATQEEPPAGPKETRHTVIAPLVGVFHTWARPKGKALVSVGDTVKVGQPVGTIQSLNVINEVESGIAGRVAEILVQEGQPVEYGQPLMKIESVEEA
ncbi:MAG TPA: biotin/lipoyl-containing protein [Ktedonobacteraceae bacterium]|nr:biotin/lipoyl-containing protein [Ktedonobacteraceae bacterium]